MTYRELKERLDTMSDPQLDKEAEMFDQCDDHWVDTINFATDMDERYPADADDNCIMVE